MVSRLGGEECFKPHQRLDSFLQRFLDAEAYEKIRSVQPCVVCCGKHNRVFKFVVLGCSSLYILENPPRSSKDILLHVALSDIESLKLAHDVPDFFNKELKDKVQHILLSTRLNGICVPQFSTAASKTSLLSLSSRGSEKTVDDKISLSASSNKLFSNSRQSHVTLSQFNSTSNQMSSFSSFRIQSDDRMKPLPRQLPNPPEGTENTNANYILKNKKTKDDVSILTNNSDITKWKTALLFDSCCSSASVKCDEIGGDLASGSVSHHRMLNDSDSTTSSRRLVSLRHLRSKSDVAASMDASRSASHDNGLWESQSNRSLVNKSLSGQSLVMADSDISASTGIVYNASLMDIYLLDKDSAFFLLLEAGWIHCKMEAFSIEQHIKMTMDKAKKQKITQKFLELQTEILDSPPIDILCVLTKELHCAMKALFKVKKLFWKEQKLFEHYAAYIDRLWHETEEFKQGYESQLDCIILIFEVLLASLQETEVLSHRNKFLYLNGCSSIMQVSHCLVKLPKMFSVQTLSRPSAAALLLLQGSTGATANQHNFDIETNRDDWMKSAVGLLYELLLVAQQGKTLHQIQSQLVCSSIAMQLHESADCEQLMSSWMKQLMKFFNAKENESIHGDVMTYKLLKCFVLLMESDDIIKQFVAKNYNEEFRYYILAPLAVAKLSSSSLSELSVPVLRRIAKLMAL